MNTFYSATKWTVATLYALFFLSVQSIILPTCSFAQCGYNVGLGCPGTNYSNYGMASNNDAASIEYDNFVSAFHSSVMRITDGEFRIWGENTAANGQGEHLKPAPLDAANFPLLTGVAVKVAIASKTQQNTQSFALTSDDKLWVWGKRGAVLHTAVTRTDTMQTIPLPKNIRATNVKSLFATSEALAMLTCDGSVFVMAQNENMRGQSSLTSFNSWTQVKSAEGVKAKNLSDIVAMRGCAAGFIALDANGQLWTWGRSIYLGDNTPSVPRSFATKMTLPSVTGTIKMIGATGSFTAGEITYYVLYGDGRLFALGNGLGAQLGNWSLEISKTWVQPRYSAEEGSEMNDIQWISPNEHDYKYPFINVINKDSVLYNWGLESGYSMGRGVHMPTNSASPVNPGVPPSLQGLKVLTVESGGHTTVVDVECQSSYGYVGHKVKGSMGDGTNEGGPVNDFTFTNTYLQTCGAQTGPTITFEILPIKGTHDKICTNQTIYLYTEPNTGVISLISEPDGIAELNGNALTIHDAGNITLDYVVQNFNGCDPAPTARIQLGTEVCVINAIRGSVWIDDNADAILDQNETLSDGATADNGGLWANLIDASGLVLNSVPVSPNGTFEIITAKKGTFSVQITNTQIGVGAIISAASEVLPSGWSYTGNNHANNSPCLVPDCSNPSKFAGVIMGNDDVSGINFGIIGKYLLSGKVFHDANGLKDNGVNGVPVYPSSSYQQQGQPPLFVCAVDKNGKVAGYTLVGNDGTYQIHVPIKQNITLLLTTVLPTLGDQAPNPVLPSDWTYVGETFGVNNASGSGNNDGSGTDANEPNTRYDGKVTINIQGSNTSVSKVDFGIQQPPSADPKSFKVNIADFSVSPPSGFPIVTGFKSIRMSSPKLKESSDNSNGSLSGTDPEDCSAAGSCNGNSGGAKAIFTIGTLKENTRLYYDFGGVIGIQEVLANTVIPDFDAEKMVIYGRDGEGNEDNPFGFNYAITDKAGITSPFVNYGIQMNSPLPLSLLTFDVSKKEATAYLSWTTIDERQFKGFEVLRSVDGRAWDAVGFVPSNGISNKRQDYHFLDNQPMKGVNLYKLKLVDQDSRYQYSDVRSVSFPVTSRVNIYPNPTNGVLNISGLASGETIKVYDLTGNMLMQINTRNKQEELSLAGYSAGTYFVHVFSADGNAEIIKVEKLK